MSARFGRALVDGIGIAWRAHGRPSAPAVVLVHSLGLDAGMWDPQVAALERDHQVVTVDIRGHGDSDAPAAPYAIERLALDIVAAASDAGLTRFHLVGLSIGGLIALWLAVHRPALVDRLVLADSAARLGTPDLWTERIRTVREGGMEAVRERVLAVWFTPAFRERDPVRHAWAIQRLLTTDPEGYVGACGALAAADLRAEAVEVTAPTLAIVGEADLPTPPDESRLLAERIPGCRLEIIEGAGHIANLEAAEAFNDRLVRFLSG